MIKNQLVGKDAAQGHENALAFFSPNTRSAESENQEAPTTPEGPPIRLCSVKGKLSRDLPAYPSRKKGKTKQIK